MKDNLKGMTTEELQAIQRAIQVELDIRKGGDLIARLPLKKRG